MQCCVENILWILLIARISLCIRDFEPNFFSPEADLQTTFASNDEANDVSLMRLRFP